MNKSKDDEGSDDEFDPTGKKGKKKSKAKPPSSIGSVQLRLDTHTLRENHEFAFPSSTQGNAFDAGGVVASSSQFGGVGFDDNFMELGDLGDELARELGEGWGAAPSNLTG